MQPIGDALCRRVLPRSRRAPSGRPRLAAVRGSCQACQSRPKRDRRVAENSGPLAIVARRGAIHLSSRRNALDPTLATLELGPTMSNIGNAKPDLPRLSPHRIGLRLILETALDAEVAKVNWSFGNGDAPYVS